MQCLRDAPCDRVIVGDAEDEGLLAFEQLHCVVKGTCNATAPRCDRYGLSTPPIHVSALTSHGPAVGGTVARMVSVVDAPGARPSGMATLPMGSPIASEPS